MNAILMSIRPQYVAKILNGEKTIEIRKRVPKLQLPYDVYIYCTKGKPTIYLHAWEEINGHVVAKFTVKKVETITRNMLLNSLFQSVTIEKSCLTNYQLCAYSLGKGSIFKTLYALFISDLVIFDKPKELQNFKYGRTEEWNNGRLVKRPPQSWCYCEVE